MDSNRRSTADETREAFASRVLIVVGLTTAVLLLLLFLWRVIDVLLLLFAGVLAGVFLEWLATQLSGRTPLSYKPAAGTALLLLLLLFIGGGWLMADPLIQQADLLGDGLRDATDLLVAQVDARPWAQGVWQQLERVGERLFEQTDLLSQFTGVFSGMLNLLTSVIVILFIGLYFAFEPHVYVTGLLRLVPPASRTRANEVLTAMGQVLRWWLLGRVASMLLLGLLWTLGLWALGIPLVLILGVLATLLAFVPYLGAVLTVVPVLLLALAEGPQLALYVVLLYAGVQLVESYLLTPLVQRQTVALPPVVTLTSQVIAGLLFGVVGVVLAPPLAALIIVGVKMLYIQDLLGDRDVEPVPGHS